MPFILAIAARALRAAFDYVSRNRSRGQFVPIIACPAELMNHRPKCQTRISSASGDDDLRSLVQRFDNRRRAKISIRALDPIAHGGQRFARVHVAQLDPLRQETVDAIQNVVTCDDPNLQLASQAQFARHLTNSRRASFDVHAAGVGNNLDIPLNARRQNPPHQRNEVACITGLRIARFLLLHDRHRDLGQIIEHQIVDWAFLNLADRRVGQITPEALTGRDAYLFLHCNLSDKDAAHKNTGAKLANAVALRISVSPCLRVSASSGRSVHPHSFTASASSPECSSCWLSPYVSGAGAWPSSLRRRPW